MNETTIASVIIILIIAILALLGYFLYKKLKEYKANLVGKNGEKKVKKAIEKIAKKYKFKTLHDIYLPLYDKTTQLDHVIIGEFGVMVIETKSHNGEIFGTEKDEYWTQIIGSKKNKLYNPLFQNKAHIDCMRHLLNKKSVYNVQIDSLVVFSNNKTILNIPKALPIISLSLLKKYIKKPRYGKDNNVNVEAIHNLLYNNRVTDNELIKNHNKNVKKMSKG